MPYTIQERDGKYCIYKEDFDGGGEEVSCHDDKPQAESRVKELYAEIERAAKAFFENSSIKAVGDFELDVLAVPFYKIDRDQQWFDDKTDIMPEAFQTPLIVYQHGVKQGAMELDERPEVVGKTVAGSLEKKHDGWHIRVILDKASKYAKQLMDAAKRGMVAVSSGSISHLARLDVGGRLIQYDKKRPGRIAVWALGEVSLWEMGNGNMNPANQFAVALPVMKAMYKSAGLLFPNIKYTGGDEQADNAPHRARVEKARQKAREILNKAKRK